MDIKKLSKLVIERREDLLNEAQVKQGLIRPFIRELGFDPDDPKEVIPEHHADIGSKKGEKVDYGIIIENKCKLLIECKYFFEKDKKTGSWKNYNDYLAQTKRYFEACNDVEFAILTDGIHYHFFANLNSSKKGMDENPFLKIDLEGIPSEEENEFLYEFMKPRFNAKALKNKASILGRIESIKDSFKSIILDSPSDETIKYFMDCIGAGPKTEIKIKEFSTYIKKGINIGLKEYMQENINKMLSPNSNSEENDDEKDKNIHSNNTDEIQAFYIIQAILNEKIDDISRISYKNTVGYFSVILDEKARQTLCRCNLEGKKKYINFCDDGWNTQTKVSISGLKDLYKHKDRFLSILEKLLSSSNEIKK